MPEIPSMFCQYGLLDVHVDDSVVMKILDKLRQDKAPEAGDIQPRYLKEIAEEVCHALHHSQVMVKFLRTGELPMSAQFSRREAGVWRIWPPL